MGLAIQGLHIGMKVTHPRYGVGVIKALTEHHRGYIICGRTADRRSGCERTGVGRGHGNLSELQVPLAQLIRETADGVVAALGLEKKDVIVEGLGHRWAGRQTDPAARGRFAPGEGSAARNIFSQDRHDPE